jgi:uncharacterized protein YuzE
MRVTFDPKADAAYIYLREIERGGAKHTCAVECDEATGMIVLDIDDEGRLIGIEVIGARDGLPPQVLAEARGH